MLFSSFDARKAFPLLTKPISYYLFLLIPLSRGENARGVEPVPAPRVAVPSRHVADAALGHAAVHVAAPAAGPAAVIEKVVAAAVVVEVVVVTTHSHALSAGR